MSYTILGRPTLTLPKDASNQGNNINSAITAAIANGYNSLQLSECLVTIETPVIIPNDFELIGSGKHEPGNAGTLANNYGGGTKFLQPVNSGKTLVSIVGVDGGNNPSSMVRNAGLTNISLTGQCFSGNVATSNGGPGVLLNVSNAYRFRGERISGGGYFVGFAKFSNVWDSNVWEMAELETGFSDPTVTNANAASVVQYTGRNALSSETFYGRSWGVPSIEIISPNTDGDDCSNNLRFMGLHLEGSACAGTKVLIHGGNCIQVNFNDNSKIEADEGPTPVFVVQDAQRMAYEGWLCGGGTGSAPLAFGGLANGQTYSTFTNPGLAIFYNCISPRITGSCGYLSGGAKVSSLFRFNYTEDPGIEMFVNQGLTQINSNGYWSDLSNATNISQAAMRVYPDAYCRGLSGANLSPYPSNTEFRSFPFP